MSKPNFLHRLIKEPMVLIALLGVGIYAGYQWFQKEEVETEKKRIHIETAQIEGMVTQWEKRWNRQPTDVELDGLVQQYVREEVLYRQAVALGLDKNDPITRRRTVQKLEFLTNEIAMGTQPSDAELERVYAANADDYKAPDLITFLQVFFNPDSRGDSTLDEAKAVLDELAGAGEPDPESLEVGDRFMLNNHFQAVTEMEVARQMGSGFAGPLMELEPGSWHGPVLSGYGVHLVYVYDFKEGQLPELEAVREKVLAAWYDEQREKLNSDLLENLKKEYEIVIDEVSDDLTISPQVDPPASEETPKSEP